MKNSLLYISICLSPNFFAEAQQLPDAVLHKDLAGYLFAYFTGNNVEDEQMHFALSADGFHYYKLNKNKLVIESKKISSTSGMRDSHILRGNDGKTFYMTLTDMTSSKGWSSKWAIVLLKSTYLINWTSSMTNIQTAFQGNEELKHVWAPQTIYDSKTCKYMIFNSIKYGNDSDKIYYTYANPDFSALESTPKQLFFPKSKNSCIDDDIIEKDGVYHLFYKIESIAIKVATARDLTSGKWKEFYQYPQQTPDAVEGACVFKLNHSNEYILMYDIYKKADTSLQKSTSRSIFKAIDNKVSIDFHPRHVTLD